VPSLRQGRFFDFNKHWFGFRGKSFEFEKCRLDFEGGAVISWELESLYTYTQIRN
jgi:hypothetical protein